MDYKVGSIADLISGKNTPNKLAVVKEFVKLNTSSQRDANNEDEPATKRIKKKNKELEHKISRNLITENELAAKRNKKKNKVLKHKSSKNLTTIDHTEVDKLEKEYNKDVIDEITEANEESFNKSGSVTDEESITNKNIDRTIFVGNVSNTVKKIQLLRFFGKYGKVLSARLRCATPANPNISKRVAVIKKMLHPKRTTLHCYITFKEREDALKATELNGQKYNEHYLRVQMCDDTSKPENSKAIFIGNLPFDVEDDDLWNTFESCGPIVSVRVVRNSFTGMGIGIGYVNFSSSDSVELALQLEDVTLKNKKLRIQRCHDKKTAHKEKYQKNSKKTKNKNKQKSINTNEEGGVQEKSKKTALLDKASDISVKNSLFQGSKSNKKKQKQKRNKGVAKKLKLSQKIAPRN